MIDRIPAHILNDLVQYMNTSDSNNTITLAHTTQQWFDRHPELTMPRPQRLYRGLYFVNTNGNHIGKQIVDAQPIHSEFRMSTTRCTSWTSILGVAKRYALNSKELLFSKMKKEYLQHYNKEADPIGIVISSQFHPHDVVCDINRIVRKYALTTQYGQEWECVVKSRNNITVRLEAVYTHDTISAL